eukprot:CAMPEP_0173147108 /NCGR_PEP_ID=MMETSP1105-20130129/8909_1 /TAXON_ID=2985 /ORGANISM="Ochromonas sp., Strain BG-1" /LENGTH=411 /DNA_ID=CAMNT_0014061471 /DNA_START=140 /DNA_END=1375 /DNA_ORIENTATION=+
MVSQTYGSEVHFDRDPPEYGVDCSYPIHRDIDRTKCPYFYDQYKRLMEGCYKYYSKEECDSNEADRIRNNLQQPKGQHNYTKIGFKKTRVPKEAWEPLIKFYNENKANAKVEKWYHGATVVNTWESPSLMVSFETPTFRGGLNVKQQIWDGVRPLIEDWVGHKIEPTSLYGIRLYTGGSVLATHVDRLPLISSCIINVDQDVDEPWPIEVYDHDGNAYNVTMEPGDLVLYESSTILHGRPFPMKGRYYANIFVHFQPLDHARMNELDQTAREIIEQGKEPVSVRRRHMPQRSLKNTPSMNTMSTSSAEASNFELGQLFRVAAAEGNLELVQSLLARDPTLIYSADENYWQALHEGIRGGKYRVVKYLVENGADLNWKTANGGNALWLAKQTLSNDDEIIRYLESLGVQEEV